LPSALFPNSAPFEGFHLRRFLLWLRKQLDEQNEDQLLLSPMMGGSNPSGEVPSKVTNGLGRDPFAGLRAVLHEQELLTKR
jgi:hypothetical protein